MTDGRSPEAPALGAYKQTPTFDETNIPTGLLKEHRTAAGVFGRIVVVSGNLAVTRGDKTEVLTAGETTTMEPQETHSVAALGAVQFYVAFCRRAMRRISS